MRRCYVVGILPIIVFAKAICGGPEQPSPIAISAALLQPILLSIREHNSQGQSSGAAKPIPIVAIAGCSGVGKTHLTKQLKEKLEEEGLRVKILRLDDFLRFRGQLQPEDRVQDPDAHPNFDGKRAHKVLTLLQQGETQIVQPKWGRDSDDKLTISEVTVSYEDTDIIIMEGIYALENRVYSLGDFGKIRLFMHAPKELIYQWMCAREAASKSPRPQELFDADIAYDFQDYERVILPSMKNAHYVLYKKSLDHTRCELESNSSGGIR